VADSIVFFRGKDGPIPFRVVRNPHPDIEVSDDVLAMRDGNRAPAQGDTFQIPVDSRGRHRAVVPHGEETTYKLADHEVVDCTETRSPNGERRRRYQLRRKG
jgi:hypothetical protein